MEVKSTRISQVVLVRFDEIPLQKLAQPDHLASLTELYGFGQVNVGASSEGKMLLMAENGLFKSDGEEYAVSRLIIEERKIQLVGIEGTSLEANKMMGELREHFAMVAGRESRKFLEPIVVAEDSEVIARLDFPYQALLSEGFLAFVDSDLSEATLNAYAETELKFAQLLYYVDYQVTDPALSDFRIGLSRKEFRLEPRRGYPLSEQVYYSKAPVSTDIHLKLLSKLERDFAT